MAQGYLAKSSTNYSGLSYSAMLYCKTNIAGYFFDGVIEVEHNSSLQITTHPVETGAAITDHAFVNPRTLMMTVMVSDVHRSIISDQFKEKFTRRLSGWEVLKRLHQDRIPVSVLTGYGLYENMLLKSISTREIGSTYNVLSAKVELVELPVARVRTVKISGNANVTQSNTIGTVTAEPVVLSNYGNYSPTTTQILLEQRR